MPPTANSVLEGIRQGLMHLNIRCLLVVLISLVVRRKQVVQNVIPFQNYMYILLKLKNHNGNEPVKRTFCSIARKGDSIFKTCFKVRIRVHVFFFFFFYPNLSEFNKHSLRAKWKKGGSVSFHPKGFQLFFNYLHQFLWTRLSILHFRKGAPWK